MAKERFIQWDPTGDSLRDLVRCNQIIDEYRRQGFTLTLRQIYYQCVSRDFIPNNMRSYKRIGNILNQGRMAGLVDWSAIEDRGRNHVIPNHWETPAQIIRASASQYRRNKWDDQPCHVECFPAGTQVLTLLGSIPIESLRIGDSVLSGDGRFHPIQSIMSHEHEGDLVKIDVVGLGTTACTQEHPWMVRSYDASKPGYTGAHRRYSETSFLPASEVKRFDLVKVPALQETTPALAIALRKTRQGDGKTVEVDDDFLAIVGLYVAEGSIEQDDRTVKFSINAKAIDQEAVIRRWAESNGYSVHTSTRGGACAIRLFSVALAEFLKNHFGSGARQKRLPEWFVTLPPEQQLKSLYWYASGDGTFHPNSGLVMSTRSHQLASQLQMIFIRCGCSAWKREYVDHDDLMYRVGISGSDGRGLATTWGIAPPDEGLRYNRSQKDSDGIWFPVRSASRVPYSGLVYNLEVEGDHTYCVPAVVHNCQVEKQALEGILIPVCRRLDIGFTANRGYSSQSAMYEAAQRMKLAAENGKEIHVLYLGDHDPSGMDMDRDVRDRLSLFLGIGFFEDEDGYGYEGDITREQFDVNRLALNIDQVHQYNPPENPAKQTDSRAKGYIDRFGYSSWELDALSPTVLAELVTNAVNELLDVDKWNAAVAQERTERDELEAFATEYEGSH